MTLSDSSYKITGFTAIVAPDNDEETFFHFEGNQTNNNPAFAEKIKTLKGKAILIIEPIHVSKAAKRYGVKKLEFFVE